MDTRDTYHDPNPENDDGPPGQACLFGTLFGLFLWALLILIYKWIRSVA
jgi:hypothetical protein